MERAKEFTDTPIKVLASAQAGDTIALHDRPDFSTLGATVAAGNAAFKRAKLAREDIDSVECQDCLTIADPCPIAHCCFVP